MFRPRPRQFEEGPVAPVSDHQGERRNIFVPRSFEDPLGPWLGAWSDHRQGPAPVSDEERERFLREQADIQKEVAHALSARLEQGRQKAFQGDDRELKKALQDMGCSPEKCSEIMQYYLLYDFTPESMAKFLKALEDLCPITNRWKTCPITGKSVGTSSSSAF